MNQWTHAARSAVEDFLARTRAALRDTGADVEEVTDDLRRHIQEEASATGLRIVTEQDMLQILARVGVPEFAAASVGPECRVESGQTAGPGLPEPPRPAKVRVQPGIPALIFGVILPFATFVFEFLVGACAGIFFDPIPTVLHSVLVLLVPAASLGVWLSVRRDRLEKIRLLNWASGLSIGIALVYALMLLPLSPFALIGLVIGLGWAALAPMFAFVAAISLRNRLAQAAPTGSISHGWALAIGGVLLVILATLPMIMTETALQMAVSESTTDRDRGVRWLRLWGDEERLLRTCYGRSGRTGGLYSWGTFISPDSARDIYYRVYGRAFNTVPPPKLYAGATRWRLLEEEFTWDQDQGGDAVAGRVKGLSAIASRQDGLVDPASGLAYLEWTLEFKNNTVLQREARAQIQLPPGGVVSRLTLWIDGEEREAAFGGRSQVKTAYKAVVTQRRDPVLVTTCGPDRILVQCFPVPPNGGTMKARIGITSPLLLTRTDEAALLLPVFVERNFAFPEEFSHTLWLESTHPAKNAGVLQAGSGRNGSHILHGQVKDLELSRAVRSLTFKRPPEIREAWVRDPRQNGNIVRQTMLEADVTKPARVVLVVDGSAGMERYLAEIGEALRHLPEGVEFNVVVQRDGSLELWETQQTGASRTYQEAIRRLNRLSPRGGQDNIAALLRGWDLATQASPGAGVIVWIHAPQPVLLQPTLALRQHLERSPVELIDVQTVPGPNRVAESLDGLKGFHSLPRLGSLKGDLQGLFTSWGGQRLQFIRESLGPDTPVAGKESSLHLARLWAAAESARLASLGQVDKAMRLAVQYQLVTPLSGAVVLETSQQYAQAGLEPVASDTVPSIPEPSAPALILLALALLLILHLKRRRACPASTRV